MAMNFEWTEEATATLTKMWAAGEYASAIAEKLGLTRSAVLGKIFRMNLQRRSPTATRKYKLKDSAAPPVPPPCTAADTGAEPSSYSGSALFSEPIEEISRRLRLDELREDTCRFPVSDPGHPDFGFCGEPIAAASPYCGAHTKLCYLPRRAA